MLLSHVIQVGTVKPAYEVADVLRRFESAYRRQYPLTQQQMQVIRNLVRCRTAEMGGYIEVCDTCGGIRIHYCS